MLSERQAVEKGLHYTGKYDSYQGAIKEQLLQLRAKYPKAKFVMIRVPHNPLSRGHSNGGYSIHADKMYDAYQTLERHRNYEKIHLDSLERIKERYNKEVVQENEYFIDVHSAVEKAKALLNE